MMSDSDFVRSPMLHLCLVTHGATGLGTLHRVVLIEHDTHQLGKITKRKATAICYTSGAWDLNSCRPNYTILSKKTLCAKVLPMIDRIH